MTTVGSKGRNTTAKNDGKAAARKWLTDASIQDMIELAGSRFEYGETLDGLIAEGYRVPRSSDRDFSWRFFKQVKGHVFHKMLNKPGNS
jgi:hypothetical protein